MTRRFAWPFFYVLFFGLFSCYKGGDATPDFLAYHRYNGYAAVTNGRPQVIAPAALQSYFYPGLDALYYRLFVGLNDHPLILEFLLGLPYALAAWLVWRIGCRLLPDAWPCRETLAGTFALFGVTGAAGFVVAATWLIVYRRPPVTVLETGTADTIDWGPILRDPIVWTLAAARLIADPVWYFYLFWFPKYLADARGMSLLAIAQLAWLVYLASDIGSVGGGWFSGWLIRRGGTPVRSRMIAMTIAAALAPFGMLIATGVGIGPTLALAALVAFAHLVFQVNMGTLIVDLYPQRTVSTVFGIIAAGSGLGGIFSTQLVGNLASSGSYDRVFLMMGLLHPLACAAVWATPALRRRTVGRSAL